MSSKKTKKRKSPAKKTAKKRSGGSRRPPTPRADLRSATKKKPQKPRKKSLGRNGGMATFIRSCPREMKARDVVAAGEKKGFRIPWRYVYSVRTLLTKKLGSGKMTLPLTVEAVPWSKHETLEEMTLRHVKEVREFVLNEALRGLR
jgi:hypothetical protein